MGILLRLDRFQRRHAWIGLPVAVVYKFFDDRATYLSASVTYYAFVSLFPLLLLFASALGFFLQGDPQLRAQLQSAALQDLPVIGPRLSRSIAGFRGSGAGLAVGVAGVLYGGLGAMQAAQAGFNQINGVPRNEQPNPIRSRLRSLGLLALLGSGVLVSTAAAALLSTANDLSQDLNSAAHAGAHLLNFAVNVGLVAAAFRLLTARGLRARVVLPGAVMAGGAWSMLQIFGSGFVSARLHHANALYGVFAVVLATLAWLYLQALILMLAAELNAVLQFRLWPRALLTPFTDDVQLTAADQRVYTMYASTQRFKAFQQISTQFPSSRKDARDPPGLDTAPANGAPPTAAPADGTRAGRSHTPTAAAQDRTHATRSGHDP